jgi:hypothetical protein
MYFGVMAAEDGRGWRSAHLEDVPDLRRRLWNRHDDLVEPSKRRVCSSLRGKHRLPLGFRHAVWAHGRRKQEKDSFARKREAGMIAPK